MFPLWGTGQILLSVDLDLLTRSNLGSSPLGSIWVITYSGLEPHIAVPLNLTFCNFNPEALSRTLLSNKGIVCEQNIVCSYL